MSETRGGVQRQRIAVRAMAGKMLDRGHADMVRLHIGHGNTEKALFFPREDLDEIYAFIKKKNPAIRIMDYAAPEPKSSKKHKK